MSIKTDYLPITLDNMFKPGSIIFTEKVEFHQIDKFDAKLILNLRLNHSHSFLRSGGESLKSQVEYIEQYREKFIQKSQIYYKIKSKTENKFSSIVRLTQLDQKKLFNWESFVAKEGTNPMIPIDIMLSIYSIGFKYLNRKKCGPWDVNKQHFSMQKIHEKIGMAKIVGQKNEYFRFAVSKVDFDNRIAIFERLGFAKILGIK